MASLGPIPPTDLKDKIDSLGDARQSYLAHVLRKRLSWLLYEGHHHVDLQPDGFVRVQQILALPPFRRYHEDSFIEFAKTDEKKKFEFRREFCKESGVKVWFVRLVKGTTKMPLLGVDRGNKKIMRLKNLPLEAQCTLTLEDWSLSCQNGILRSDDNLIHLHAVRDNPFDVNYGPGGSAVLVDIDVHAAFRGGLSFYISKYGDGLFTDGDSNGVLPPIYFTKAVKVDYECERSIRKAGRLLRFKLFSRFI